MSEEILKALTQLFAIITRQGGGVSPVEREYVIGYFQSELDQATIKEYIQLYDKLAGAAPKENAKDSTNQASLRDSVQTLAICKKINRTLTQKQKVVVLVKLFELIAIDKKVSKGRMAIIDTIATVFNISPQEIEMIQEFVSGDDRMKIKREEHFMVVGKHIQDRHSGKKKLDAELEGHLFFVHLPSVDMYFVKYMGTEEVWMNGYRMKPAAVYLFSAGSTIKLQSGDALYYSETTSQFHSATEEAKISFIASHLSYRFTNGQTGVQDVNLALGPGNLVGIMGASGAGKTTLLNVMAGIYPPSGGNVTINGLDIHKEKESLEGVIGYVAQDDLLIEELTVFENLYYNARLCFDHLSKKELDQRVMSVLKSLGLEHRKHVRVGNVLDNQLSGGQRKRLNIALELIREPAILFVDEPTSGLSSRDSENVIDLLKELSLKGKLIFVVIHQPSSDIYKMFDKLLMLDTGGYPIFYGNPVEAVTYFKKSTNQVDGDKGQCPSCGNVNPEKIFQIVEAQVVDEFGQLTGKRKINPKQWHERFVDWYRPLQVPVYSNRPPTSLQLPNRVKQAIIFSSRNLKTKLSNKPYLIINLLEAPLLAAILAFIIRYKNTPEGTGYLFRYNDNIPAFIMMAIIVALFMGLTVSAEEIIRDRKILKRESFLNLSWNSYLISKVGVLFLLAAIQTLAFVLVGSLILEMHSMTLPFWFALFTVACFAIVVGLNISSAFHSAVTVYILIPLLLIPQMILSGLLFNYEKLNDMISAKGSVPVVADLMASRWAYEAMAVHQFKSNPMQKPLFALELQAQQADYKAAYWIPELRHMVSELLASLPASPDSLTTWQKNYIQILHTELQKLDSADLKITGAIPDLSSKPLPVSKLKPLYDQLGTLIKRHAQIYVEWDKKREKFIRLLQQSKDYEYDYESFKNKYYNESLADLVKNVQAKERIVQNGSRLIQQINPIYQLPVSPRHPLNYRTHFYAPVKFFMGVTLDTFTFNLLVIWFMTLFFYVALYYGWLKKLIDRLPNIKISWKT